MFFGKNITEHKTYNDFPDNFCPKHISSQMYIDLQPKFPLFMSDFNKTWILSSQFQKILKYTISWKSIQWELRCSMQTDGQTWQS
jgi:hypothetical protein